MNIKNIVFDIGGVLADPKNGHWFITPNFWNIINRELVNEEKLQDSLKKHLSLQTQDPKTTASILSIIITPFSLYQI